MPVPKAQSPAEASNLLEDKTPINETQPDQPKKKICCACPETKSARDECIVLNGEEACKQLIQAHNECLRKEGFNV